MKTLKKTISMLMAASLVLASGIFTSCDDDDYNTSQFKGGVSLTAAQFQVTRGSYMQFKGSGLDKITSVIFPVDIQATPEVVDKYTIRCLVPEEATVGTVKLVYNGGMLETDEPIGFTEPVKITEFTKTGKAGDVLTIKGRYLEYFTHARFATGEPITLNSVSRDEVTVKVPVDASTGEMVLLYYTEVNGEKIANETPVGEVMLAQPAVASVAEVKDIYPGDEITIKGTDLNLIQFLTLPGGIKVTDFKGDASQITFVVPAEMQAGVVVSTSYAGITTSLLTVSPKAATISALINANVAELADTVKNGGDLIIKGVDLKLVSRVEFVGADAVTEFTVNEAGTEIKLAMPAMAQSGDVKLVAKSEAVATTKVVTLKPKCTGVGPWPQIAGKSATFYGTDIDLIKSITLPSGEVLTEFTDHTDTELTVVIPYTASGAQFSVVEMTNGEVLKEFQWVNITAVDYCYPLSVEKTYQAGFVAAITVVNLDKLTSVKIAGEEVTFIKYDETTLYLPMTYSNVGVKKVELISGESTFEFEVNIVAGIVETPVYEEPIVIKGWSGVTLPVQIPLPLPEGAVIRIRVAEAKSELQFMDGYWGQGPNWAIKDDNEKNNIHIPADAFAETGYVDIDPTTVFHDENGNPWWDGKVMLNADGVTVSSITIVVDYSAGTEKETTIWEGNVKLSWTEDAGKVMNFNAYDFRECKAGSILKFYYEAAADGMLQFNNANWKNILGGENSIPMSEGSEYELELTQDMLDMMINDQPSWAGDNVYFFNLQGQNATLTKVTIIEK
ncbi:MAG: hypothetical protein MJZ18_07640 [Bacteroidales bacterium]|nr:hypothetical protein [Bacteroidales bacterium]